MYDTDVNVLLYTDTDKNRRYYMTTRQHFYVVFGNGDMKVVTADFMRKFLGERDIAKYIEVFGTPKEG